VEVVQLKQGQKASKYDINVTGKKLKFHIEYDGHGAHVCWYEEVKVADNAPKAIRHMIANGDEICHVTFVGDHIMLTKTEKFFGISLESKVRSYVKKTFKELKQIEKEYNEVEQIKKRIEEI
jgi:ribonucleotide reductase beta subunit family protein with ferritin-like domain